MWVSGHGDVRADPRCEQESAGWWAYAGAVVDAVAERRDVIVVGHSLGGFTAPLVCARGHYVTLSRPRELAERLHAYAASLA